MEPARGGCRKPYCELGSATAGPSVRQRTAAENLAWLVLKPELATDAEMRDQDSAISNAGKSAYCHADNESSPPK